MYLFPIWQMQKIEQVMPNLSVILPAPENPYLLFKNTIYWKVYDIPMIRLGFASHVFWGLSDPWRANTATKLQNKKKANIMNTKNCFSIRLGSIHYSFIHPSIPRPRRARARAAPAPIHPSIHPCIHPFIHPFIHLSIHSSIHPSIHAYIHPSTHPSMHRSMISIHPACHVLQL